MRVTYRLAAPELGGGTKVVFQHAELLRGLGHEVTVVGEGPAPEWIAPAVPYLPAGPAGEAPADLPPQDLVIATFWTTIAAACELARARGGRAVHLCQGYEGGLVHLAERVPEIEAAYARPLPALVVSPHLGKMLARRFGRPSRLVPPPVDPLFRPQRRPPFPLPAGRPRRRPWIAVPGIFEAEVKGVPFALEAVKLLRRRGIPARLLRISPIPLGEAERRMLGADRELSGVPPAEVAAALRGCDLLLFPSGPQEGFGLPVLEAFASGVPAVASAIPSVRAFAAGAADLVPPGDPEAMADAAERLLRRPLAWRSARRAGLATARAYRPRRIAPRLETAVRWAAEVSGGTGSGGGAAGGLTCAPVMDLSVVIPAYNEAARLGPTLDRVIGYLEERGGDHEVLVVDDGSTDATAELVRRHPAPCLRLITQDGNRGKGAAIRRGVEESRGRRVLLTDADLSTPIEELPALEARLEAGADLALGSRAAEGSAVRVHQPLYRELMGKTFNLLVRLFGVRGVRDTQCGFKLLDGEAARRLFARMSIDGFAFDVELVWLARRFGYRVDEVGVEWWNSEDSRVDPVTDSLAMLRDVVVMRWRHRGTGGGSG